MNEQDEEEQPPPVSPSRARRRRRNPATFVLIAANLAVFGAMVANGVDLMSPSVPSLLKWGANFGVLTMTSQPWRLITSFFVHVGLIHIAVNMYSLYVVGPATERIFGTPRYVVAYFLSGLGGGIASIAWNPVVVGAGASGAIFGIVGALLGFFFRRRKDLVPGAFRENVSRLLQVVLLNVILGFSIHGIDNAAHLGGLTTGFFAGFILAPTREPCWLNAFELAGMVALLAALGFGANFARQQAASAASGPIASQSGMNEAELGNVKIFYSAEISDEVMERFADEVEKVGHVPNDVIRLTKTRSGIEIGFVENSADFDERLEQRKARQIAKAVFPDEHVDVGIYDKNWKLRKRISLEEK
ncbi:MAG TPA: rhomboid family intramembrane serine protease [Planctomycetota bacterium]|nr:rhomboid family intramembrane serine protease [Planctomycetota bacterium]